MMENLDERAYTWRTTKAGQHVQTRTGWAREQRAGRTVPSYESMNTQK